MLIKNAMLRGAEKPVDLLIENGRFARIAPDINADDAEVIDAGGRLVTAPFVDTHCHLDYVGTSETLRPNMTGSLFEAIQILQENQDKATREELKAAAEHVLKWQIANGTQFVRTHVNTDAQNTAAIEALLELREQYKDFVTMQLVAFPQYGVYKYPDALAKLENALKMGVDVIGAIPHCEYTREDGVESVKQVFALAQKYGVRVDVHCDEIDDEQSRFVEVVAAEAIRTGLFDRVTASHTTAMGSYNNAYAYKLFSLLQASKINIICNATINTNLQGRFDTYPKRRGLTRVKELTEAGINVSMGTDDIMDPCYPLGSGSMLEVLHMALHVCHLTGRRQMYDAFDLITDNGAKTMGVTDEYGIETGKPGNLLILDAKDELDAERRLAVPLYSIRGGRVIATCQPKIATVHTGATETVHFGW